MKTILTTATALLLTAACTPAPQICEPCVIAPAAAQHIDWPHDDDRTERTVDVSLTTLPEEPTTPPVEHPSEPETPPVTEPPSDDDDKPKDDKDDKDDKDGKGENDKDCDDKDKPSQEIAEDKEDD